MRTILIIITFSLTFTSLRAQELEVSGLRSDIRHSGDVVSALLPLAGVTAVLIKGDWQGLKQGAFSAATTLAATILLKEFVDKERPDHSDSKSFPSRHAAFAFATATFVHCRYGWKWAIPCYAASAYISWTRVYGKKHDWWDVVAGAAIGAGSSLIFTKSFRGHDNLSIVPAASGEGMGFYAAMRF